MIGGEPYTLGLFDTAGKYIFNEINSIIFLFISWLNKIINFYGCA